MHHNFSDTNIPIAKIIKEGFEEIKPDLVIIEGIANSTSKALLGNLIERAQSCFEQKKFLCSEPIFAAYLANKQKTKFIGIEPSDAEIIRKLKS